MGGSYANRTQIMISRRATSVISERGDFLHLRAITLYVHDAVSTGQKFFYDDWSLNESTQL